MKLILYVVLLFFGVALFLLGGLWLLQGADLVHIQPIACVANCEPVTGFTPMWLVAGAILMLIAVSVSSFSLIQVRRWLSQARSGS